MSVRVRFAPSPTGSPHVGIIRTALFNHLFAKGNGGANILRIEDTDRSRFVPGAEEELIESLAYIGVEYQEGPIRQSERKEQGIYDEHIRTLLDSGDAYWAFDTPEELAEMREYQQINKMPTGYFGGDWRGASASAVEEARAAGKPGVIRLKVPRDRTITLNDAIRGRVEIDSNTVDDPVLIKGDGMPTYHFAAMVDDHLMGITHVFRGEEWISSAPKHLALFEAFGWGPPQFVHVPQIKGKDGKKLSKRHGDTSCLSYKRAGYLGEAMANFIALIGWAPGGDKEIMTMDEMAEAFSIEGIQPSPGVFDMDKLNWMNGAYMRAMNANDLAELTFAFAEGAGLDRFASSYKSDAAYTTNVVRLEQERAVTLVELCDVCEPFLVDEPEMDPAAVEKWLSEPHVPDMFAAFRERISAAPEITEEWCETLLREYQEEAEFEKLGPVVHPVRVALTGRTAGPGLWQLMAVLGRERLLSRLQGH